MAQRPSPRRRDRLPGIVLGLAVAGCRFGHTGESPFAEVPVADSGSPSSGEEGTSGTTDPNDTNSSGGAAGASDPGAGGAAPSGDGSGGSTTTTGDASAGAPASGGALVAPDNDGSAGAGVPPGDCQPPATVAICDPIRNTGCFLPVSFCDIDPTQSAPTGRCVFPPSPAPAAGAPCELTIVSESCPPLSSCVNGACRKLCYCDSDCQTGECCTEPAPGPPRVFKLCEPC